MPIVRVATFNVHHCEGLDGRVDVERIARVIEATSADLVALQELDRWMTRSHALDQPAELTERTGMRVSFFPTLRRGGGEYGIAIATRSGDDEFEYRQLPRLSDEEPRGYVVGPWQGITVIATHLSLRRGPRDVQTKELIRLAASLHGPFLLLGDLNQGPWTFRRAVRGAFAVPLLPQRTMARRWAQRDHIVGGGGAEIARRWVLPTTASDHYTLGAEVRVP